MRSRPSAKVKNGLEDILKKSSRLMANRGFSGTSMRDLARETGRSLAGLYHYFRTKEDLLFLINFNGFSQLLTSATELKLKMEDPDSRLKAFVKNHVEYFCDHMDEMRVMIHGTLELDAPRHRKIKKLKVDYGEVGKECVRTYLSRAWVNSPTEKEVELKTFLLFGMMNWIYSWFSSESHGSPEALSQEIFETFAEGCRLRRGQRTERSKNSGRVA